MVGRGTGARHGRSDGRGLAERCARSRDQAGVGAASTSSDRAAARTQRFKVQPRLFQFDRDLADCAPVSLSVQLRAYRPLAPLNLRVQGDGHCPTYSTGQDIAVTWDQSSPERAVREPEQDCPSHADCVIPEVWDGSAGAKKGEWTFDQEAGGMIANTDLVAALGAETDFVLKAYNQRGSLRSLACAQLAVTKT